MDIEWRKSSFSTDTDNCLEVAVVEDDIWLRESDAPHALLRIPPARLHALVAALKSSD